MQELDELGISLRKQPPGHDPRPVGLHLDFRVPLLPKDVRLQLIHRGLHGRALGHVDEAVGIEVRESDRADLARAKRRLHIVPTAGNLSFEQRETRYNVTTGDYVILPNAVLARDFAVSPDFAGLLFSLSPQVSFHIAIRSDYGIVGHLSLLQNPVMRLTPDTQARLVEDIERLRVRLDEPSHLSRRAREPPSRSARPRPLRHPREVPGAKRRLKPGGRTPSTVYGRTRARELQATPGPLLLSWYAEKLCVTPEYLSEICRKVSGRGAGYFVDLFTVSEIARALLLKNLPVRRIAEDFAFSSPSYSTRYVVRHLGMTPGTFRRCR